MAVRLRAPGFYRAFLGVALAVAFATALTWVVRVAQGLSPAFAPLIRATLASKILLDEQSFRSRALHPRQERNQGLLESVPRKWQ